MNGYIHVFQTTTSGHPKKTLTLYKEFRVPIINGVTMHEGALLWILKDILENVFNAGGNASFSTTALGADIGIVTSTERLLTSYYLGR